MVSNPYWRKSLGEYEKEIVRWLDAPNMEDVMNMAIFVDSIAVAGERRLLAHLKRKLYEGVEGQSPLLANFAKPAVAFETPIGIFAHLIAEDNRIDVKKGGIFPIVHGVRSLALEYKIEATDTVTRIKKLAKEEVFDANFASTLIEALDTFLSLRLKERLERGDDAPSDNLIRIEKLNQLELELLKDSFKIVNTFKKFLTHHFKLSLVS